MKLNPKFKTGQGPSGKYVQDFGPISEGTTKQKEMRVGSTVTVPDPQSFQGGRLKPVRTKKKKDVYKKVTKKEFKEMEQKIPNPTRKEEVKKLASKKTGGSVKKMNMGGVMKNRGGTFKGIY